MLARSPGTSRARVLPRTSFPASTLVAFLAWIVGFGLFSIAPQPGACRASEPDPLTRYGKATWSSLHAMESPIGLPADGLDLQDGKWTPRPFTSPSDIGAYLWSLSAADSLGIASPEVALAKASLSIETLGKMATDDGLFYNWYDPATGKPLTKWPTNGAPVRLFLSAVDNAWLEVGIRVVGVRYPKLRDECERLVARIKYRRFLPQKPSGAVAPAAEEQPGVFHVGYYADTGALTRARYSMLNSETRMIFYLALIKGEVDADLYRQLWRVVPAKGGALNPLVAACPNGCMKCSGAQVYESRRFVPSWGGSMFEALMVPLFVPEECWSPDSWGENHRRYVRAQQHYGLLKLNCGFWGFSPCMDPSGGYAEFGAPPLSGSTAGYSAGSKGPVITPHASFLALPFDREGALLNLDRLEKAYPCFTDYGFFDAVNVKTGEIAKCVLAVDQGMCLAAIANDRADGAIRRCFTAHDEQSRLQKMLAGDRFCFEPRATPLPGCR